MTHVWSAALTGVAGVPIEVEVRISSQLPRVDVVGLPEAAVRESVSRIRGAIAACGLRFPDRRVTVNLAPAELRKSGAGLDLPIAIGVLAAHGDLEAEATVGRAFFGELALDGRLRPSQGILSGVIAMRNAGMREAIVPTHASDAAARVPGIDVRGAGTLAEVLAHLTGQHPLARPRPREPQTAPLDGCVSEIRGQAIAKRGLEIAAAGGHGLLMLGPPGTGKTQLARRLAGLLPPLDDERQLESICIHDAVGLVRTALDAPSTAPFRAPHHSASAAGLLGGGQPVRPGEVSLAHHGVLFLDELPEFDRRCLESLREVLEQGLVRIARAGLVCELPARFQLIAAANPCPCGYYGTPRRDCRCDDATRARYQRRFSGPLLDRIDLSLFVGEVSWAQLRGPAEGPTSLELRARVRAAQTRQSERGLGTNARIPDAGLDEAVRAEDRALDLLGRAVDQMGLSARVARRLMRVARTIADLADQDTVGINAMAEAISLRVAP